MLVHILLMHGVMVHTLPHPKQSINVSDTFFLSNRGFYMPQPLFQPLFWLVVAAFVIGVVYAFWYRRKARIKQAATGEQSPVFWVMLASIVGLPILAYLLTGLPIDWQAPEQGRFNLKGGMAIKPEFMALWLALSMYTAAFIAETVSYTHLTLPTTPYV